MRGQRRAFLPSDDMAAVVAGEVDPAVGLNKFLVRAVVILRRSPRYVGRRAADPRAQVVWNLAPVHIHRVLHLLAVSGMQLFDRLPRSVDLGRNARQLAEVAVVLNAIARNNHSVLGKQFPAWIPDNVHRPLHDEGKAAVKVVILLPEAARLPGHFVSGVISDLCNGLFDARREIVRNRLQNADGQRADAIVRLDRLYRA